MLVLLVQKLFRFLRRPSVLVLILLVSLAYCLIHLFSIGSIPTVVHDPDVAPPDDIDPLLILHQSDYPSPPDSNDTGQSLGPLSCRNSVQGKLLIADDRGYVCERADVGLSGCCNTTAANSHQHWCDSCDNDCCSVYEHCVSCCLHPDKKSLLHSVLAKAPSRFRLLLASVTDQFELCLTKCRTDSQSVLHQNVYRNAQIKYCFGQSPPPLERTE